MTDNKNNFKECIRCGRKFIPVSNSRYCGVRCKTTTNHAKKLAVDLVKEVYNLILNKDLFSDKEIGERLRSKKIIEKFDKVLFIGDKNE